MSNNPEYLYFAGKYFEHRHLDIAEVAFKKCVKFGGHGDAGKRLQTLIVE